jgi:hypothetical protein
MISFYSAVQMKQQGDLVRQRITLGEAISRLLSLLQTQEGLRIHVSGDGVTTCTTLADWITSYKGLYGPDGQRFRMFCKLIACFRWFVMDCANEHDTKPITFEQLCQATITYAQGRQIPELHETICGSTASTIAYLAGWLLGRQLDLDLPTIDDVAALILALQEELDHETPLETAFAECFA